MKDNEFRELVNALRDVALQYHDHESLRERIRRALSDALKKQEPVAIKIGNYGEAFDGHYAKRAYTYEHQPGNEVALKLGRAAAQASFDRGGDLIDFGLSLLRTLSDEGFGVFGVGAEFFSPVSHTSIKEAIIDDLQAQFDTEGITEGDSGDALIRLSDAIAAVEDNWTGVGDTQMPSVPEGWQLVPKVPTQEMVRAGASAARAYMQEHGGNSPHVMWSAMLAAAPQPERSAYRSQALDDVIAERRRQIEVEGWTPEHDDEHKEGEMAVAAGYYALQCGYPHERESSVPTYWPWDAKRWKPRDKRRNMIKSVALGLAEIERMDRAERSSGDERGAS